MRSCDGHKGKKEVNPSQASGFAGDRRCSECGKWFAMRTVGRRPFKHSGRSFLRSLKKLKRRRDEK